MSATGFLVRMLEPDLMMITEVKPKNGTTMTTTTSSALPGFNMFTNVDMDTSNGGGVGVLIDVAGLICRWEK